MTRFALVRFAAALLLGAMTLALPQASIAAATEAEPDALDPSSSVTAGKWDWPTGSPAPVTRIFDLPHPYAAGHRGIDLAVSPGAAVFAPADGVVHFAGWVVDRPVLSIRHTDGLLSSFEPVEPVVAKGDAVARGQVVGHLASDPVHAPSGGLHFGARLDDAYLDPLALLGAVPRAVLLPLYD